MHRSPIAAVILILSGACAPALAQPADTALTQSLQTALTDYVQTRAQPEHISAASLSISLKGTEQPIDLAAGTTQYGGAGAQVAPGDLFEIGSITKSFTAVAILHLEAAGKLGIDDTLGKFLPQYPAWKDVTIRRMLDMTSPIPGYDNQPSIARMMGEHPDHVFTPEELVAAAYPHDGEPKPVSGWTYSNTNYILCQMIIEKVSGKPYADVVRDLFGQVGLKNTYYEPNHYPASVTDRMVSGYFFSHDPDNALLAPLLGHDVKNDSVSWMQAAGGIVSTAQDVSRWARALYEGPLLADKQRHELMTVVSDKTGQPVDGPSQENPGYIRAGRRRGLPAGDGNVLVLSGHDARLPHALRVFPRERGHHHRRPQQPARRQAEPEREAAGGSLRNPAQSGEDLGSRRIARRGRRAIGNDDRSRMAQQQKRLVVTADDFGLSVAVNEGIERAHRDGILTSASLMVAGGAAEDAVRRARAMPGLAVGLHLVVIEGPAMLPRAQIPALLDSTGRFPSDQLNLGLRYTFSPAARRQLHKEIRAQFAAFAATRLLLDHADAHKHMHLHPVVGRMMIEIGREFGLRAIRVPHEPGAVLARCEHRTTRGDRALARWTGNLRLQARRAGLRTNDNTFGIAWSGHMTRARVQRLLPHLPPGLNEIYFHPAAERDATIAALMPDYEHTEELATLTDPATRAALGEAILTTYGALA